MNNDLISRSALKHKFAQITYVRFTADMGQGGFEMFSEKEIEDIIDKVPTVEVDEMTQDLINKVNVNIGLAKPIKDERPKGEWIPVGERLPEERINPYTKDFDEVLCTTVWGDVRAYKFGAPIGHDKPHFWFGDGIMDEYIIAWQPLPEPYKKGGAE